MKLSKTETDLINQIKKYDRAVIEMDDKNAKNKAAILNDLCERNILRWEIVGNKVIYTLE